MATIRAYTTIEQSKVLAEILPLESADMCYLLEHWVDENGDYREEWSGLPVVDDGGDGVFEPVTFPCWSLAVLLNVLPSATLDSSNNHCYRLQCRERTTEWHDNAIDACYEMIIKLNELKML